MRQDVVHRKAAPKIDAGILAAVLMRCSLVRVQLLRTLAHCV